MAGYRGDGYGQYGDHGDDDFRFGDERGRDDREQQRGREPEQGQDRGFFRDERRDEPEHGAAHGNLMGRAEQRVREWTEGGHFDEGRPGEDPRARRAAGDWDRHFGREGYEGSYAQHQHDEPYRSFRQKHLDEMDRDYDAWRQDRQQEFQRDFDSWRSQRRQGSTMSQQQPDEMPALELSDAAHATSPGTPVTAEQPGAAGSQASRRRGSSGSTPGGTASPTDEPRDR